jgi:hypothetical protein
VHCLAEPQDCYKTMKNLLKMIVKLKEAKPNVFVYCNSVYNSDIVLKFHFCLITGLKNSIKLQSK